MESKMKKTSRIICILLAVAMAFCLVSCGKTAVNPFSGPASAPSQTPQSEPVGAVDNKSDTAPQEQDASSEQGPANSEDDKQEQAPAIDENGEYDSKDEVALYIHTYGRLPSNYITKKQAQALGWNGGSLEPYAPGKSIGGGRFGNYEGLLPEAEGRTYTECDIDTRGKKSRGAKRIVFSNDGLVFYTEDHYESFELLYGEY